MKPLKLFAAALLAATAIPASAQFSNNTIGQAAESYATSQNASILPGYANLSLSYAPLSIEGESMPGVSFGMIGGISISKTLPLYFEFGINMNINWKTYEGGFGFSMVNMNELGDFMDDMQGIEDYDDLMNYDWDHTSNLKTNIFMLSYSVPVHLAYRIPFKDFSITPFTGLNFKLNAVANMKINAEANDDDEMNNMMAEAMDDMSIDMLSEDDMYGYEWKRLQVGWNIGANFDYKKLHLGIRYTADLTKIAEETSSSTLYLSLGFNFGLK